MRIGALFIVCVIALSLTGCFKPILSETTMDVTQSPEYWGGYQPGSIYQLEQAVFLGGIEIKKYSLTPEGYYDRFDTKDDLKDHKIVFPCTIKEYTQKPDKFPDFALVSQGVTLKCTKIIYWDNGTYTHVSVYGVLLSGEFENNEVYLNHVSMPVSFSSPAATIFLAPDIKYLKKVNP